MFAGCPSQRGASIRLAASYPFPPILLSPHAGATLLLLPFVALAVYLSRNGLRALGGPLAGLGGRRQGGGLSQGRNWDMGPNSGALGAVLSSFVMPIMSRMLSGGLSGLAAVPKIQR